MEASPTRGKTTQAEANAFYFYGVYWNLLSGTLLVKYMYTRQFVAGGGGGCSVLFQTIFVLQDFYTLWQVSGTFKIA
jgi:hypothetical protein